VNRTALAAAVTLGLLAGCGGSGDDATVVPAADRSGRIAELNDEVDRLKRRKAEDGAKRAGVAERSAATAANRADQFLSRLPGTAGLAVAAPGAAAPAIMAGDLTTGDAWSTIKVPIAERVLVDAGGPGALPAERRNQISAAITRSDNDAAAALFAALEQEHGGLAGASKAVGAMLRRTGDANTEVSTVGRDGFSTYGQTDWSLADQAAYMAALAGGCSGNAAIRSHLLGEMEAVGGSDTFGLGATGYPARWKGGWGPGTDGRYLVRQMGVMEVAGRELVLAMAAIPDDGSFETGGRMLTEMAGWAARHLAGAAPAAKGC